MEAIVHVMSAIGAVALTGAIGLLIKHLTVDHNKINGDLEEIKKDVKLLIQKKTKD